MNNIHKRKISIFVAFALGLSIAFALIIYALRQNLNVFVTPTELVKVQHQENATFRLGGMVKPASVQRVPNRSGVSFIVTDLKQDIKVSYDGILPDLFREGTGVIVEGRMNSHGVLIAANVLAKHDENYMPKSTYKALRKQSA